MSSVEQLYALPDVSFVNKDVEAMLADAIARYEQAYFESTGVKKTLMPGDPIRIWIYSETLKLYTAYQLIDFTGKQNSLRYASGDFLDLKGADVAEFRARADFANSTVRFTLSATQSTVTPIPRGTRVTPGNNIFFETTEYTEIPIGQTTIDVPIQCTEAGPDGNGFTAGQINILVDPIPYIVSVANLTTSQGGVAIEEDESFREKVFLKPESFSVAGPTEAYEYWAKKFSASVLDVKVTSPIPGVVDIRFILANGEIPNESTIGEMLTFLSDDRKRPLTDNVTAGAPEQVTYNLSMTFYIGSSNAAAASSIQAALITAIDEYILWQKSKIGRDIDPGELDRRIRAAGAKRAVITSPVFTPITGTQIAALGTTNIVYGGLEEE